MTNINKEVWTLIDNDIALKKNLLNNLINVSALARKITREHNLEGHADAVISAIRRYEGNKEKKDHMAEVYSRLKEGKLTTRTKLASVLLRKSKEIRKKLASLYSKIEFESGDTLRIFEVTKYIKIITDDKRVEQIKETFNETEMVGIKKGIGELSINYQADITKTPGLFATLSNELAANNISIIDSMICYWEHIIIVEEDDLQKTFETVFALTRN